MQLTFPPGLRTFILVLTSGGCSCKLSNTERDMMVMSAPVSILNLIDLPWIGRVTHHLSSAADPRKNASLDSLSHTTRSLSFFVLHVIAKCPSLLHLLHLLFLAGQLFSLCVWLQRVQSTICFLSPPFSFFGLCVRWWKQALSWITFLLGTKC